MASNESLPDKLRKEVGGLTTAIADMLCTFKQLEQPLIDTHSEVPRATSQLDRITRQTEKITQSMLDMLEKMTGRDEEIIQGLDQLLRDVESQSGADTGKSIAALKDRVNTNLTAAYKVIESLQFQDITAQQMNYAASLLDDIGSKLHEVLKKFGSEAAEEPESKPARKGTFDPNANLDDSRAAQADIDTLFSHIK
jgi:chemotaxis regulatin CheY-phosphate phosphatase CheZ